MYFERKMTEINTDASMEVYKGLVNQISRLRSGKNSYEFVNIKVQDNDGLSAVYKHVQKSFENDSDDKVWKVLSLENISSEKSNLFEIIEKQKMINLAIKLGVIQPNKITLKPIMLMFFSVILGFLANFFAVENEFAILTDFYLFVNKLTNINLNYIRWSLVAIISVGIIVFNILIFRKERTQKDIDEIVDTVNCLIESKENNIAETLVKECVKEFSNNNGGNLVFLIRKYNSLDLVTKLFVKEFFKDSCRRLLGGYNFRLIVNIEDTAIDGFDTWSRKICLTDEGNEYRPYLKYYQMDQLSNEDEIKLKSMFSLSDVVMARKGNGIARFFSDIEVDTEAISDLYQKFFIDGKKIVEEKEILLQLIQFVSYVSYRFKDFVSIEELLIYQKALGNKEINANIISEYIVLISKEIFPKHSIIKKLNNSTVILLFDNVNAFFLENEMKKEIYTQHYLSIMWLKVFGTERKNLRFFNVHSFKKVIDVVRNINAVNRNEMKLVYNVLIKMLDMGSKNMYYQFHEELITMSYSLFESLYNDLEWKVIDKYGEYLREYICNSSANNSAKVYYDYLSKVRDISLEKNTNLDRFYFDIFPFEEAFKNDYYLYLKKNNDKIRNVYKTIFNAFVHVVYIRGGNAKSVFRRQYKKFNKYDLIKNVDDIYHDDSSSIFIILALNEMLFSIIEGHKINIDSVIKIYKMIKKTLNYSTNSNNDAVINTFIYVLAYELDRIIDLAELSEEQVKEIEIFGYTNRTGDKYTFVNSYIKYLIDEYDNRMLFLLDYILDIEYNKKFDLEVKRLYGEVILRENPTIDLIHELYKVDNEGIDMLNIHTLEGKIFQTPMEDYLKVDILIILLLKTTLKMSKGAIKFLTDRAENVFVNPNIIRAFNGSDLYEALEYIVELIVLYQRFPNEVGNKAMMTFVQNIENDEEGKKECLIETFKFGLSRNVSHLIDLEKHELAIKLEKLRNIDLIFMYLSSLFYMSKEYFYLMDSYWEKRYMLRYNLDESVAMAYLLKGNKRSAEKYTDNTLNVLLSKFLMNPFGRSEENLERLDCIVELYSRYLSNKDLKKIKQLISRQLVALKNNRFTEYYKFNKNKGAQRVRGSVFQLIDVIIFYLFKNGYGLNKELQHFESNEEKVEFILTNYNTISPCNNHNNLIDSNFYFLINNMVRPDIQYALGDNNLHAIEEYYQNYLPLLSKRLLEFSHELDSEMVWCLKNIVNE